MIPNQIFGAVTLSVLAIFFVVFRASLNLKHSFILLALAGVQFATCLLSPAETWIDLLLLRKSLFGPAIAYIFFLWALVGGFNFYVRRIPDNLFRTMQDAGDDEL